MKSIIISIIFIIFVSPIGCAGKGLGLGTISKTSYLYPGMSSKEVTNILGNPSHTEFIGNKLVWKYSLHQYWKGWMPFYLAFDKENNLESWYADENEYRMNQQLWLQAFPPTQHYKIDVDLK
jgi:hypothetical protein